MARRARALFRAELDQIADMKREPVRLAGEALFQHEIATNARG